MKIKFGAIVVAGSGKIGGHVASKNRGGAYLRTKVTPTNPNSPAQALARSVLGGLSTQWSGLTEDNRSGWNNAVADFSKTDIFGDIKQPSGINLYVKLNANLIKSGQAPIIQAPAKVEVPFSPISTANFSVADPGDATITFGDSSLNGIVTTIRATKVVTAGTSYVKNLFRDIASKEVTAGVVTFGGELIDKFGTPAVGDKFFLSVSPVMPNGQAGVPQTIAVIVTA